jgi:hypothetical protein
MQGEADILFRENFSDLKNWETFYFSGKKKASEYVIRSDSNYTCLEMISHSSASGIIYQTRFDPSEYSILSWRWRVQNIISEANGKVKDSDDYPIRIFVMFDDDSAEISFWQSIKNAAAKIIYGIEPPESSLCFVWANIEYSEKYFNSPYSETVKIIPIEMGDKRVGHWITRQVNIASFYQEIFKRKCPSLASLAIMSDTDNTGSDVNASIDYIELRKE